MKIKMKNCEEKVLKKVQQLRNEKNNSYKQR